jgi:hypothetical protein
LPTYAERASPSWTMCIALLSMGATLMLMLIMLCWYGFSRMKPVTSKREEGVQCSPVMAGKVVSESGDLPDQKDDATLPRSIRERAGLLGRLEVLRGDWDVGR